MTDKHMHGVITVADFCMWYKISPPMCLRILTCLPQSSLNNSEAKKKLLIYRDRQYFFFGVSKIVCVETIIIVRKGINTS